MTARVAAVCMGAISHIRRVLTVVEGLVQLGAEVTVWTSGVHRAKVLATGAGFVDLFEDRTLDQVDPSSRPNPSRSVSFAGVMGASVTERMRPHRPDLVLHDTFAVVGRVLASEFGVPAVNVQAGHALVPSVFLEQLKTDDRVAVSDVCWEAARTLRERHGMLDAHPFCYLDGRSPHLNLYCEPPQFLSPQEVAVFEPIAFVGSLPVGLPPARHRGGRGARLYAAFGSSIWRYWTDEALETLRSVAAAAQHLPGVTVDIGLGGTALTTAQLSALAATGATVHENADQRALLAAADLFITHHGLNSTHEALQQEVPMLSYPFHGDQPAMAAFCASHDLAAPLPPAPRVAPTVPEAVIAIDAALEPAGSRRAALAEAAGWEADVIARRPAALQLVLALAAG